jgi:hypothetical protein
MRKFGNLRAGKGLEIALASALAFSGFLGIQEAKAHNTNWPNFYFVLKDINGNPTNEVRVGPRFILDVCVNGMNDLGNVADNQDHNLSYKINFSITNALSISQAILMSNNFWQAKSFSGIGSAKAISNRFDNGGNLYANISLPNPVTNAVYGNDVAVRYIFNTADISTNQYINVSWISGNAKNASSEIHYINGDAQGGYPDYPNALAEGIGFWMVPEPSTGALGIVGGAALALRNRRRYYSDLRDKLQFNKKGKFVGMRNGGGR